MLKRSVKTVRRNKKPEEKSVYPTTSVWMKWGANASRNIHDSSEMNLEWEYNAFNKQRVHKKKIISSQNLLLHNIYLCIFAHVNGLYNEHCFPSHPLCCSLLICLSSVEITTDHCCEKYEQRMMKIQNCSKEYRMLAQTKANLN